MDDNIESEFDEDLDDSRTQAELKGLEERLNYDIEDYDAHTFFL